MAIFSFKKSVFWYVKSYFISFPHQGWALTSWQFDEKKHLTIWWKKTWYFHFPTKDEHWPQKTPFLQSHRQKTLKKWSIFYESTWLYLSFLFIFDTFWIIFGVTIAAPFILWEFFVILQNVEQKKNRTNEIWPTNTIFF